MYIYSGNSWHHSFPPYALDSLARLHGGSDRLIRKLHQMIHEPSSFNPGTLYIPMILTFYIVKVYINPCIIYILGTYGQQIHEMTEFRAGAMGQYGHNNQPCHHILWLFAQLGERTSTEKYVRQIQERAYGADFFAGDEDNGEQGAWFVLSALGLFSTTPGTPDLVLGSPLFKHVVIDRNLPDKQPLHIVALGTDEQVVHVDKYLWNGSKHNDAKNTISEVTIGDGGILQFVMSGEKDIHPVSIEELTSKIGNSGAGSGSIDTKKLEEHINNKKH